MSAVYLSSLKLKGFRSYAGQTEVTFPSGPGLTVIVGPNGFGKSTLFDAVEWALAGDLKRMGGIAAKDKEKKESIGSMPHVQLSFSDGTFVSRRSDSVSVEGPAGLDNISDWLAIPKWRGLNNIADCLQFTHFLGQSTRQLFVHQDGAERWNRLEGPAGLETIRNMVQILGSRRTTVAFNKMAEDLDRREHALNADLQEAERLRSALQIGRELARAGAAISPEEITAHCGQIDVLLQGSSGTGDSTDAVNVDLRLQRQQVEIESAERAIVEQNARLEPWTAQVQDYLRVIQEGGERKQDRYAAEIACRSAEADAVEAVARKSAAQEAKTASDLRVASVMLEQDSIRQAIREHWKVDELEKKSRELDASIHLLASCLIDNEAAVTEKRSLLATVIDRRKSYDSLVRHRRTLAELGVHCEAFLKADSQRREAEAALAGLPQAELQLQDERQALTAGKEKVELEVAQLKSQRAAAADASTAITTAVAQIAAALRQEDCACPVCKSKFDEQGLLKKLASQQAEQSNQRLAAVEAALDIVVHELRATREQLAETERKQVTFTERRASYNATINFSVELEHAIRGHALLTSLTTGEFMPSVDAALAAVDTEIGSLAAEVAAMPAETAVAMGLAQLEALSQASENKLEAEGRVLTATRTQLEVLRAARIQHVGLNIDELHRILADKELAAEQASQVAAMALSAFEQSAALAELAAQRAQENRRKVSKLDDALKALAATRKVLADSWTGLGYAGVPEPAAVLIQLTKLHERSVLLQRLASDHEKLVEGRRQYLARSELGRLEEALNKLCAQHETADVDMLLLSLQAKQAELYASRAKMLAVRQKRDDLQARMKERSGLIRSLVTVPLNDSIEKFCAVLMSDRDYRVRLDAVATAVSAQALLSFQRDSEDAGDSKNPLLYMSEGQLAAVSLCLLFGASVTYPWSRWKALLLDDPLHHNDSIHTAAFIDVARNLIKNQHYQIVVSTHDMEQAGYFLRKCANAGINTRYWHLYGRSADGTALMQEG